LASSASAPGAVPADSSYLFFQIRFGQHADLIVLFDKQHSGHESSPENPPI
jgi:hypothetical protein